MLYHLPYDKLEDLILALAGQDLNWVMGNILLDEIRRRGGPPEGCEEAVNQIIEDTAVASTAATNGMTQLRC